MKSVIKFGLVALLSAFAGNAAFAQDDTAVARWQADPGVVFDATEVQLSDFAWLARPVVIFADSPNDPRFQQQIAFLMRDLPALAARDVVLITDTDPDARSDVRIGLRPRGFMLTLLAKDGTVTFRKPAPWDVREISRSIDKMPLRQQEIEDRRLLAR